MRKNCTLFLKDKNFGYRIAVDPGKYTGLREIWTNSPRTHDKLAADAWIKLQEISCPKCSVFFEVKNFKLRNRLGHFSNIMCKRCGERTASNLWECTCGERWTKCMVHQPFPRSFTPRAVKRKNWRDQYGVDAPLPKHRRIDVNRVAIDVITPPAKRIRLKPGSILAQRFPHLAG